MTDVLGNKKSWSQSKTIIINLVVVAIGIATYLAANYTPENLQAIGISPTIANEVLKASPLFIGIGNILLRSLQTPTQIN